MNMLRGHVYWGPLWEGFTRTAPCYSAAALCGTVARSWNAPAFTEQPVKLLKPGFAGSSDFVLQWWTVTKPEPGWALPKRPWVPSSSEPNFDAAGSFSWWNLSFVVSGPFCCLWSCNVILLVLIHGKNCMWSIILVSCWMQTLLIWGYNWGCNCLSWLLGWKFCFG